MQAALFTVTLVLAFVSGSNDGATLTAIGARTGVISPLFGVLVLSASVGAMPALAGTKVATTLAHGLVSFEHSGGKADFLMAALATLVVVFVLSRRGLPTSVTLALNGAIVGVGIGAGLSVGWSTVGYVLAAGVLAPLIAGLSGFAAVPGVGRALRSPSRRRARGKLVKAVSYLASAGAYGANDAQKMVAFAAIATGAGLGPVHVLLVTQAAVACCFAAGALYSVRRLAGRITEQMVRAPQAGPVAALFTSSAVVTVAAALGLPIGSTQTATAGLIGATRKLAPHRTRAEQVLALGAAWVATLPSAALLGVVAGLAVAAAR